MCGTLCGMSRSFGRLWCAAGSMDDCKRFAPIVPAPSARERIRRFEGHDDLPPKPLIFPRNAGVGRCFCAAPFRAGVRPETRRARAVPDPNHLDTSKRRFPPRKHLSGVWGTSASNVWAVGGFGSEIVHYDGVDWRVVECPTDKTLSRRLGPIRGRRLRRRRRSRSPLRRNGVVHRRNGRLGITGTACGATTRARSSSWERGLFVSTGPRGSRLTDVPIDAGR